MFLSKITKVFNFKSFGGKTEKVVEVPQNKDYAEFVSFFGSAEIFIEWANGMLARSAISNVNSKLNAALSAKDATQETVDVAFSKGADDCPKYVPSVSSGVTQKEVLENAKGILSREDELLAKINSGEMSAADVFAMLRGN